MTLRTDHAGRVVVVTGASSGIGRASALAFAERGAIVVGVARREDRLIELVDACRERSASCSYLAGDLGERPFAESVVQDVVARFGRLDVLVHNAALPKHKHVLHLAPDEAERVMRVNFLSMVWTTLAALPVMLAQDEAFIVNVSSFAAAVTPPREAVYAASKAAMNAFTAGLWLDLEGSKVHAAIVNPGPIDTEIWDKQDEPASYRGRKHPTSVVTDAIFEVIERRRHEITVPKRSAPLVAARWLRALAPSLLRRGMARMDPVPRAWLQPTDPERAQGRPPSRTP